MTGFTDPDHSGADALDQAASMADGLPIDPVAALDQLGAIWSPDFDAYASGQLDASRVRCALCQHAPCDCSEFGTPEYFALIDLRHGRIR